MIKELMKEIKQNRKTYLKKIKDGKQNIQERKSKTHRCYEEYKKRLRKMKMENGT